MVQVTIDQSGANKKFARLEKAMLEGARRTSKMLAELGLAKAQQLVPKASGKTGGAIYTKPKELSNTRASWVITAPEVYPFPVVRIMQGNSTYAKEHWKKRSIERRQFMKTTRDYLNVVKGNVAKGSFRNVKIN